MSDTRQHVHEMIDRLEPDQLPAIEGLLERILAAPDDQVNDEDRRRFQSGRTWFAQRGGKGIPINEVLAEFGLTPDDFPLSK